MTARRTFARAGLPLSCLDFGGAGRRLLALHSHFGCGRAFADLAARLAGRCHVAALDQRNHGWSGHTADVGREAQVEDVRAALDELGWESAVVLGHSVGGVNAFQLAARHPERVEALVVVDIGAETTDDLSYVESWPARFDSVLQARAFFALQGHVYPDLLAESLTEDADGWGLRFNGATMAASQRALNGEWWSDWEASRCPALVLRGEKSAVLSAGVARRMAGRPGAELREFAGCTHALPFEAPAAFAEAVGAFVG